MTRFLVFLLVLNANLALMSSPCRSKSGFCAVMMFSAFSGVTASGTLYIIILGLLSCIIGSRW
jgi:hypothetical protein